MRREHMGCVIIRNVEIGRYIYIIYIYIYICSLTVVKWG